MNHKSQMLSVCYMKSFLRLVLLSTISLVKLSAIKSPCTISDKVLFRSSSLHLLTPFIWIIIKLDHHQLGQILCDIGPHWEWYCSMNYLHWIHALPLHLLHLWYQSPLGECFASILVSICRKQCIRRQKLAPDLQRKELENPKFQREQRSRRNSWCASCALCPLLECISCANSSDGEKDIVESDNVFLYSLHCVCTYTYKWSCRQQGRKPSLYCSSELVMLCSFVRKVFWLMSWK